MKHKFIFTIVVIILITASATGLLLHRIMAFAQTPADPQHDQIETIVIESGETLDTIARELHRHGLIRSPLMFKLIARYSGQDTSLQSGEYHLSSGMSPLQILDTLQQGKVRLHKITVPEGYTLKQIAQRFEQASLIDATDFMKAATRHSLLRELKLKGKSFEGYLFPETYLFPKGIQPEAIIRTMVKNFQAVFQSSWHKRARKLGFSVHEVVTLASIIEKETGAATERPLISSVFHNRLKKGMRLESDPTVIYGIPDFDGDLTRRHLRTPTPYNTYAVKGLPAGPIANPGKDALHAALFPSSTNYLFFVSKNDGTHHFSTTFKEHNRAVRKYQLRR